MSDENWLNGVDVETILSWPELADVRTELYDPRFANRTHGSRSTYTLGCRGPLCKIAERDRSRRRNEYKAHRAGREYDEGGKRGREYDRDDLLLALIRWHKLQLAMRRIAS